MKYLDRAPKLGNRVHIEFDADYRMIGRPGNREHLVWASDSAGTSSAYCVPDTATIHVIAPEPKVGDIVTPDVAMGLPDGSVIECLAPRYFAVCVLNTGTWWRDSHTPAQPLFNNDAWRIVRIGGAS